MSQRPIWRHRTMRGTQKHMGVSAEDDWEEVSDARAAALASVLGPGDGMVFHAPHPFALGGHADVLGFFHHLPGAVYVTAELTGKPEACYANYELMICHRAASDWGPNVISRLAPYTQHRQGRAKAGRMAVPLVLGAPQESRHPPDGQEGPLR